METYTKVQVAKMLQVSVITIERLIKAGKLEAIKMGSGKTANVRITKEAYEQFLKNNKI